MYIIQYIFFKKIINNFIKIIIYLSDYLFRNFLFKRENKFRSDNTD